jgi:hypothetical protein
MLYFDHDASASTDRKIMQLRLMHGGAAVDAYWYFVERMHLDEKPVCVGNADAMRVHCYMLCTDIETLQKWLDAMFSTGLLWKTEDGLCAYSERAKTNIEAYQAKREKASSAAAKRWENASAKQTHSKRNANAKQTQCQEKKRKEKDGIAIKGNTNPSASSVAAAAKAAPLAAKPDCPLCGVRMFRNTQIGKWQCPNCNDTFTDAKLRGECA